jgi:biotin carboxyl carrier protein
MPLRTFIFMCYRRQDSGGQAGRLYDRLAERFGEDQVFMDIDRIEPGQDFVEVIEKAVGSCWLTLVVIGRDWLTLTDAEGRRRLDAPEDYVRLEIAAALARDIVVIPVLVQDARVPRSTDLPAAIAKLSRRQTVELRDTRWREDVGRLLKVLEGHHKEFKKALERESQLASEVSDAQEAGLHIIASPFRGAFYRAPAPTLGPFVEVGYHVHPDTTVGIIKAIELMTEIYAEVRGTIREVYAEDGQDVTHGQPLFGVEKD